MAFPILRYVHSLCLPTISVKLLAAWVKSEGTNTMVVVLLSIPISESICIRRNSKAMGLSSICRAPCVNFSEASSSASALIMRARFSRMASASRAIARCMEVGISTSFISTISILIPQGELLDLTQVETGNIQLHYQRAQPRQIVEYATQALSVQAAQKNVQLETVLPEQLPAIQADVEKTAWVMINLLSNAIRYAPEGSRVIVEAKPGKEMVEFSVRDFGKGIEPQYQTRIFEKFFRIPDHQYNPTGTGLGLAISKEFINAQNGDLYLQSHPGEGCRFAFVLPALGEGRHKD